MNADTRREIKGLGKNRFTQKVIMFFELVSGFIGVHPFFSAVNCRL
jgi:hypothetical protein